MNAFLLLGSRPRQAPGEMSLHRVAHDLIALQAWHGYLRRWGLLRSFALAQDPVSDVRACLVVSASGYLAARRMAAGWERLAGYRVNVLALRDAAAMTALAR